LLKIIDVTTTCSKQRVVGADFLWFRLHHRIRDEEKGKRFNKLFPSFFLVAGLLKHFIVVLQYD